MGSFISPHIHKVRIWCCCTVATLISPAALVPNHHQCWNAWPLKSVQLLTQLADQVWSDRLCGVTVTRERPKMANGRPEWWLFVRTKTAELTQKQHRHNCCPGGAGLRLGPVVLLCDAHCLTPKILFTAAHDNLAVPCNYCNYTTNCLFLANKQWDAGAENPQKYISKQMSKLLCL